MRATAAFAALLLAIGAPWALRLRVRLVLSTAESIAVASLSGLLLFQLSVLMLVSFDALSTTTLVIALVLGSALGALPVVGRAPKPGAAPQVQPWWASLVLLAPVAVGSLLLRQPAHFIFETGDMGDYVNTANRVLRGHGNFEGFPPGFTAVLTGTGSIFGIGRVDAVTPVIAMVGLLLVVTAARRLSGSLVAAVAVGSVMALNPLVQWFSVFGISETLFAAVLVGSILLLLLARAARDPWVAMAAGSLMGPLLVIRGNALLVVVAVAIIGVLSLLGEGDDLRRVQVRYTAAALAASLLAYAYVLWVSGPYMVLQLARQVPDAIFGRASELGLFESSPWVTALCGVLAVAVLGAGELVLSRWRFDPARWPLLGVASGLVALAGVVISWIGSEEGLLDSFGRIGWVPVGLGIAGVVVVAVRSRALPDAAVATFAVFVLVPSVVLFVDRVPENFEHSYHLYWDRYLTSEALPMIALFGAVALASVLQLFDPVGRRVHRLAGPVLGVVVVAALAGWGIAAQFERTELALEERFLGNAFDVVERIAEDVGPDAVVLYDGPEGVPTSWFFPNTFRAFAYPLNKSWGIDTANLPATATDKDPQVTEALLREIDNRSSELYVLVGHAPEVDPDLPFADDLELVDEVRYTGWLISRRKQVRDEEFREFVFELSLYRYVGSPVSA